MSHFLRTSNFPRLRSSPGCAYFPPLRCMSRYGQVEAAEQLAFRGASPAARDIQGNTPLHLACGGGGADVVRMLLAHGSSLNVSSSPDASFASDGFWVQTRFQSVVRCNNRSAQHFLEWQLEEGFCLR